MYDLLPRRHPLHFITQSPPVIRLQLRIFDSLLTPVLVQTTDMVLARLEMDELVTNALLDEHAARMLLHD